MTNCNLVSQKITTALSDPTYTLPDPMDDPMDDDSGCIKIQDAYTLYIIAVQKALQQIQKPETIKALNGDQKSILASTLAQVGVACGVSASCPSVCLWPRPLN